MTGFDDIQHASRSDVGVRRNHNQDHHAALPATDDAQWQARGHVFLVADGMGAHAVGEMASEMAASIIPHTFDKYAPQGTASALRKAFIEANTSIHNRGQQNPEFEGMGTTATALVLRPDGAWIGHVGDSRAYRIRDGQIDQLSYDHSLVWEWARRKKVQPEEIKDVPSNVIIRSLGPEPLVPIDIEGVHAIRPDDIYLLCSDGLSGQVSDALIGSIATALPPDAACRFLIDLANYRGGPDNITVVIVHAGAGLATPPPPPRLWSEVVPWPLAALAGGTLLAAGAVGLMVAQWMGLAVFVFLVALAALVAGGVGLARHYKVERKRASEEADRPRPKVHRSFPCRVDRDLVEKWRGEVFRLRDSVKEKNWEVDWDVFSAFLDAAQAQEGRGDTVAAFRDLCQAMQVLLEAVGAFRTKGEVFQPVWDKHDPNKASGNGRYRCDTCGRVSPTPPSRLTPMCCDRPMKKMA